MEANIYKTKEVPKLAFEVSDSFEPIEEQLMRVKKILIERIDDDLNRLQIQIKQDLGIKLTTEEKYYKMYVIDKKPIDDKKE